MDVRLYGTYVRTEINYRIILFYIMGDSKVNDDGVSRSKGFSFRNAKGITKSLFLLHLSDRFYSIVLKEDAIKIII